jgi:hypothetical protein
MLPQPVQSLIPAAAFAFVREDRATAAGAFGEEQLPLPPTTGSTLMSPSTSGTTASSPSTSAPASRATSYGSPTASPPPPWPAARVRDCAADHFRRVPSCAVQRQTYRRRSPDLVVPRLPGEPALHA